VNFRSKLGNANRQAADWLARLHADDRTAEDEDAFRSWLQSDKVHEEAFESASSIWTAVGGLRGELRPTSPLLERQSLATEGADDDVPGTSAGMTRRAVMAGGGALVVTAGISLGWQTAYAGVITTNVGEQRRVVLEDGTRAMLDTNTRIRFRAKSDIRLLSLESGRIDLDIAVEARPFVLDMGNRQATTASARLDVSRTDGGLHLTAISGSARIDGPSGRPVALTTGSRIAMIEGREDQVDRPELEDLIAWQGGRLVFRDDTIAQAIAEMNRYSHRALVVTDPKVATMRFSGAYRVGDPEAFAHSLGVLLPIRVMPEGDTIRIVAAS
jgi:transmembrane sensor